VPTIVFVVTLTEPYAHLQPPDKQAEEGFKRKVAKNELG